MQIRYFDTAWNDIKNSPGWFGKLCLLALVNFIPIFGQMVTFGYLFGWAREISWGAHRPMPSSLFSNEDGKFWRRGWFIFVLTFVLMLIPIIVMSIGQSMQISGISPARAGSGAGPLSAFGGFLYLAGILLSLFVNLFIWIGGMRVSIYDRLSAGFQLGKSWKMLRHDTSGIMRVFGMYLLVNLIIGIVLSVIVTVLLMIVMFAGLAGAMSSGYSVSAAQYMTEAQATQLMLSIVASAGVVGIICLAITIFVANLATAFVSALVYRALGYWTMQFDVPQWRGQDDPMPFEQAEAAAQAAVQPVAWDQGQPNAQPPEQVQPDPAQNASPYAQDGYQQTGADLPAMPLGASGQEIQPGVEPAAFGQEPPAQQAQPTIDSIALGQEAPAQQPQDYASPAYEPSAQVESLSNQPVWESAQTGQDAIIDRAAQSVQEAQDAVSASSEVQAYDAQIAAWQREAAEMSGDDTAAR